MQTVNANPALEALKDIHTPAIIENWPIAIGYWLVLMILISSLIFTAIWLTRRYKRSAAKPMAIRELDFLDINHSNITVDINTLIKRAAISYLPRDQVAGLEGQAWYAWMDNQVKHSTPALHQLLDKRYQRDDLSLDEVRQLKYLTKRWLTEALPINSRTSHSIYSPTYTKQLEQVVKC